jgi:hypothetical protein
MNAKRIQEIRESLKRKKENNCLDQTVYVRFEEYSGSGIGAAKAINEACPDLEAYPSGDGIRIALR